MSHGFWRAQRLAAWKFGVLVFLIALGLQAQAQDDVPLRLLYSETVTGEISDETYAHHYTFSGAAGDVVVIEMISQDRGFYNPLYAPILILHTSDNQTLADTSAAYSVDDTVLVAELPALDDYRLTATREGGADGQSSGAFTLTLRRIPFLEAAVPMTAAITSGTDSSPAAIQYYAARFDLPFGVRYAHLEGDFFPALALNRLDSAEGGLRPVATIGGSETREAVLGRFQPDTTYIITLAQSETDFYSEIAAAVIELEIDFLEN